MNCWGSMPTNVMTVAISPRVEDAAERRAFYLQAVASLASRPDVAVAGATGSVPFGGWTADEGAVALDRRVVLAGLSVATPPSGYRAALL